MKKFDTALLFFTILFFSIQTCNSAQKVFTQRGLFKAARENNAEKIERIVLGGVHVDAQNIYGKTALMSAAQHGNLDAIDKLIQLKANADAKDQNNWSPLVYAFNSKYLEAIDLLVRSGANIIEFKDWALSNAIINEEIELMRKFKELGGKTYAFWDREKEISPLEQAACKPKSLLALLHMGEVLDEHLFQRLVFNSQSIRKAIKQYNADITKKIPHLIQQSLEETINPALLEQDGFEINAQDIAETISEYLGQKIDIEEKIKLKQTASQAQGE